MDNSNEDNKSVKEDVYEIYTVSGNRIKLKAAECLSDYEASDLCFYNAAGEEIGCFQLENVEGWRIVE